MNRQRAFQSPAAHPQQSERRAYTVNQICERLSLPRRTFFHLRLHGRLPFLEEITPRLGRVLRYRADLVDRYVSGQWRDLSHAPKSRASSHLSVIPISGNGDRS